jgi:hypothetical protein
MQATISGAVTNALAGLFAVFVLFGGAVEAASNTMILTDRSGTSSTNYPFQFGQPFVPGEIPNYPQVLINGTPVETQADVKNRHPDGSVKYSVLAIMVASIPANGKVNLSFRNQTSGNNAALTTEQLLSPAYDFDATIEITSDAGRSFVSARAMLRAGKCTRWTSGQIAQTMLCADDTAARAYDMGFDDNKSLRPRFYVTFWPSVSRVTIRCVGENALVGYMKDIQYNLRLSLGATNPKVVYSRDGLIHPFLSRWTKTFWQGGAPQQRININSNLAYLASTYSIPNFDVTVQIPDAEISGAWAKWQSRPHDLYDAGLWTTYMPTTGGRDDIGLMPGWAAKWLYTGDWRLREIALGQADLASAWPLHIRESRARKKIDKAQTVSGLGLPLSVFAEPSLWFPNNNGIYGQGIALTDRHTIATGSEHPGTGYGWVADLAHQPSPFYVPYLLTGDPYYLEETQLWAAASALAVTPGNCAWGEGAPPCRGPGAGIGGQTRSVAWAFHNRVNAASITPDDQPVLKKFFRDMVDDAVALFEGRANITGTKFQGTPEWNYGRRANVSLGTDPLYFESYQGNPPGAAQWQHYYLIQSLGHATERGFPVMEYKNWIGRTLTGQFTEAGYNRYNLASYWIDVKDAAGAWYPTWTALQTANVAAGKMTTTAKWPTLSYAVLAKAASSFLTDQPKGQTAYDWLRANVAATEPQFNFVARGTP